MSVEYRSIVYLGWNVNEDEVSLLNSDVYENLMNSGTLVRQNDWMRNSSYAYIFCDAQVEADEESIISLSNFDWPEPVDAPATVVQFYKLFPKHVNERPELKLMLKVY